MLLRKYDIANCSLSEFLDYLDEHLSQKKFRERFVDFIYLGLEFLLTFPNAKNISFFSLNEESYNFDYITSVPDINAVLCEDLYQSLVETGKIGEAIDSESYLFVENDNKIILEKSYIIPVFKKSGLIGIILFILKEGSDNYNKDLIHKINIFFRFYSSFLENIIITREFDKTKALLEQRVAVRTMDIAHSKRELQAILNSVNTAILVVDPDSDKIIHSNSTASQLLGRDFDQIVGHSIKDFLDPTITGFQLKNNGSHEDNTIFTGSYESKLILNSYSIPILRATSDIKLGLQKMRIESFLDISDRKKIELELKLSNQVLEQKVQDRTEDLQIMVHKLKKEVEERKRAENEVRKMLLKEKELNELKTRFISLVSHEFRTPLTIINSAAQIIQRYREKLNIMDQDQYLTRIMQTVDQMAGLLENVLLIGKSEVDMMGYNPSRINVIEHSKSIINDIELGLENERIIKFRYDVNNEFANLDEKLLRHILLNLFTNAIKYSPDDSEIFFNISQENEDLVFEIIDFGIGIPDVDQSKIFEQFYRAGNVGNISGTGLGMSVIMKSIERMNGRIIVESSLGNGTRIKVILPTGFTGSTV